jgi:uncharacterized HAD superfamily protein/hypoxanthine phosphoribosyltransferase
VNLNYRSTAYLAHLVASNIHRIPREVDVIAGIPRSGLLAANLIALALNKPLADIEGLCEKRFLAAGHSRMTANLLQRLSPEYCKTALIVDDSVASGRSLETVRNKLEAARLPYDLIYCAIFVTRSTRTHVDLYFEVCPTPRMFEWNVMHHPQLAECCVDLDGVLCLSFPELSSQAGFTGKVRPRFLPTQRIGCIVTNRSERCRGEVEEWLRVHQVKYDGLAMLNVPDAQAKGEPPMQGRFMADVFRKSPAILFIGNDRHLTMEVAYLSGKHALCVDTQEFFAPNMLTIAGATQQSLQLSRRIVGRLQRLIAPAARNRGLTFSSSRSQSHPRKKSLSGR